MDSYELNDVNEEQKNKKDYDRNVKNYIENFKEENKQTFSNLLNSFNENNVAIEQGHDYGINYYLEPNYSKEFYCDYDTNHVNANPINYYFGSFDTDDRGLEKSQLKTLFNVLKHCKENKNHYVSINGGPGVGKSTIANYIISNLLLQDYLQKDSFEPTLKTILLTGTTIKSVKNISEITTIKPSAKHNWISNQNYFEEINFLFYKLDIDLREIFSESLDYKNIHFDTIKNKIYIDNELFEYIYDSFVQGYKNYFEITDVNWNEIGLKIENSIKENINIIQSFNNLIAQRRNNDLSLFCNKCFELNNVVNWWQNIDKKDVYMYLETLIKQLQNIELFQNSYELNKIEKIYHRIQKKIFRLFWTKKRVFNTITYLIKEKTHNLIQKLTYEIDTIKQSVINIKRSLKNDFVLNLNFLDNIEFNENNINESLLALDEIVINFNLIQKELDKKIRLENSFLWRHYQEWKFINELLGHKKDNKIEFKYECLKLVKPIFSGNVQKINMELIKGRFDIDKFDYVIVDEASQMKPIYALFLELIAKNIFALGDEKQLPAIINKDKEQDNYLKNLESEMSNSIKYKSLLEYVNQKTSLVSELSDAENKSNKQKGLFLLEHFRCPEQIFKLFNKNFYDNTLHFMNTNFNECSISKLFNSKITCNDTSFIYLTYQLKDDYLKWIDKRSNGTEKLHINIKEIEIGFNFIIDNFEHIKEHVVGTKKDNQSIEKMANNLCFISLHKNQNIIIDDLIKYLTINDSKYFDKQDYSELYKQIELRIDNKYKNVEEKEYFLKVLSKIKIGTIDSLQGIGCEFVIFSIIHKDNQDFENDTKRINVLWSRVKKHFIQIMCNQYWEGCQNTNDLTISARQSIENDAFENGYSKIVIDVDKQLDLNLEKINKIDFKNTDKKTSIIGYRGEKIFNSVLKDKDFKQLIVNKIKKHTNKIVCLDKSFESNWCNENKESYECYDFVINKDIYVDVKSTIKGKSDSVFMSQSEFKYGHDKINNYLIAKVNDVGNYNLNFKDKSTLIFILKNINFFMLNKDKTINQLWSASSIKSQEIIFRD